MGGIDQMNMKALVAEFAGTFALIFVGVSAISVNFMQDGSLGLVGIALAHGLTIAVMASATMHISGGHLNPAVTFGLLITGKIDLQSAIGYMIAQILGALLGAILVMLIFSESVLSAVQLGTPALATGVSLSQGLIMEIILTFFLMFVIFGTAVDKRATKLAGLFIGLTVTLDILAGGPITGAAMNPARFLGPAIMGGGLENFWLYLVGPLAGASIAALLYHHVLAEKTGESED